MDLDNDNANDLHVEESRYHGEAVGATSSQSTRLWVVFSNFFVNLHVFSK